MDNRALGRLLNQAGLGEVRVECRAHAGVPARCVCSACRSPACLECVALRAGILRCAACPGGGARRWLMTPMAASAACIGVLALLAVAFQGRFETAVNRAAYSRIPEPPAVVRAMAELLHAKRCVDGAAAFEAHGDADRAAEWRRRAAAAYGRFESRYPDGADRAYAVSCARLAHARLEGPAAIEAVAREFPREPAGMLAALESAGRYGEPELRDLNDRVRRYELKPGGDRRFAIESATQTSFTHARRDAAFLLARSWESSGRVEEAAAAYEEILRTEEFEPARVRLKALRPAHEVIRVERIDD